MRARAKDLFVKLAHKMIFITISDDTSIFFTIFNIKTAQESHLFFKVFTKWYFYSEIFKFITEANYTPIQQYKLCKYIYRVYQANASPFSTNLS